MANTVNRRKRLQWLNKGIYFKNVGLGQWFPGFFFQIVAHLVMQSVCHDITVQFNYMFLTFWGFSYCTDIRFYIWNERKRKVREPFYTRQSFQRDTRACLEIYPNSLTRCVLIHINKMSLITHQQIVPKQISTTCPITHINKMPPNTHKQYVPNTHQQDDPNTHPQDVT